MNDWSRRGGVVLLVVLPLVKLAAHLAVGRGYGYHGDELYYLACADHLDFGYVDHPPFSILVLAGSRLLVGDSVTAIRIVPAVAGALTVLMVGLIAKRLGGGPWALALAMIAAIAAPYYLSLDAYFSMNAIDILLWAVAAWIFLVILQGDRRDGGWALLGVVLGIALLNKLSGLWLSAGLLAGLAISSERQLLRTRGPWLAATCAFVLFLPHVIWQVVHRFPTAAFMYHSTQNKIPFTVGEFFRDQVTGMLPVAAPVWIAGLVFYLALRSGHGVRALGWAWVFVFALLALSQASRNYYLAASFTWLVPAGAVAIERALPRWGRWAGVAYIAVIALKGLEASPFVLPILPEATISARSLESGAGRRVYDRMGIGPLPEFLGHMTGYEETVDAAARAYSHLPEADRGRTPILGQTYRVASAIDVLGRSRGLPPASSGHNSYWLWGPHGSWDGPILVVGMREPRLREYFREVSLVEKVQCDYCRTAPPAVWVTRGMKLPLADFWRELRDFE